MPNERYGGRRPTHQWRVMPEDQERLTNLLRDIKAAEANHDTFTVDRLREEIRSIPNFPLGADPATSLIEIDFVKGIIDPSSTPTPSPGPPAWDTP